MSNFQVKINLQKLNGSFITDLKGRTATKRCLVLPIEDSDLFMGQKGVYLDLTAYQLKDSNNGKTHILKQSFSKERYNSLTEEQRRELPIIGDMNEFQLQQQQIVSVEMSEDIYNNLPY